MIVVKKNLILGTLRGYKFYVVEPFLTSLKQTGYAGDICFFCSDMDQRTLAKLRERGVRVVPFVGAFPYLEGDLAKHISWTPTRRLRSLGFFSLRHLLAYCYLKEFGEAYRNVMVTDVRDVIFQKDPFDFSLGNKLCLFSEKEATTIGEHALNAQWIESAFGKAERDKLSDKQIVCAGITIGPSQVISDYEAAMLELILQAPGDGWDRAYQGGIDQGVHNFLVHSGRFDQVIYENNRGPVLTLGLEDSVLLSDSGRILNTRGDLPNVVHQYDRHWRIARHHYGFRLKTRQLLVRAREGLATGLRTYSPSLQHKVSRARTFWFKW